MGFFWRRNKRQNSQPKIAHIEHIRPDGKALPDTPAPQYVPYSQRPPGAGVASTASTPSSSSRSTPPNEYTEYMSRPPQGASSSPQNRSPLSSPSYGSPGHGGGGYGGGIAPSRSLSRSRSNSIDLGPVSQPTLSATLAAVRNPDSFMIPDEEIFSEQEHQAYTGMVQRQATMNRGVTRKKSYWKSGR